MKGYFSLVQFCPDLSRMETANVGIILFCPSPHFFGVKLAQSHSPLVKLVAGGNFNSEALDAAKVAMENRLNSDAALFVTLSDLQHFISTRANSLQLTALRSVKVADPVRDLDQLFKELVAEPATDKPIQNQLAQIIAEMGGVESDDPALSRSQLQVGDTS